MKFLRVSPNGAMKRKMVGDVGQQVAQMRDGSRAKCVRRWAWLHSDGSVGRAREGPYIFVYVVE